MMRKGVINPEDLIDDNYGPSDKIVIINCQCCGKPFHVLERDLYIENVVHGEYEPKLDPRIQLQSLPKCPHCGYSSKMTGALV